MPDAPPPFDGSAASAPHQAGPPPSPGSPPAPGGGSLFEPFSPSAPPEGPGVNGPQARPASNQTGVINPVDWQADGSAQGSQQASQTLIGDGTIQLSVDGNDFVFLPGTEITVGRDPECLVTLDERHSLVSRRHLKMSHRDGAWYIDDYSSKGTFIDGRRINSSYKAEGAFVAQLGDDDAGTPMKVITAGEHRSPRSQSLFLLIAVGVLALVAILALALALRNRGNGETVTVSAPPGQVPMEVQAADLASAKQSTVLLLSDQGLGSGFFVADNLIVTNQHVAALASALQVAVSREADDPAEIEFLAETVAVHPYLDIAVLQLTFDDSGNSVADSGLPSVTIGDSLGLTLGDEVYNTGFPQTLSLISRDDAGELLLPPVSATSGEAASFAIWPGCSNPDRDAFIPLGAPAGVGCAPEGDVAKGIVITTFSSGQGASGSPVFRGNEVIAVVFAGPEDEANAGRNISTASFKDWLDGVIADNG